jgi:hypothetical protein
MSNLDWTFQSLGYKFDVEATIFFYFIKHYNPSFSLYITKSTNFLYEKYLDLKSEETIYSTRGNILYT